MGFVRDSTGATAVQAVPATALGALTLGSLPGASVESEARVRRVPFTINGVTNRHIRLHRRAPVGSVVSAITEKTEAGVVASIDSSSPANCFNECIHGTERDYDRAGC